MACPLRVFLFIASLLLLGAVLLYQLSGQDAHFYARRRDRTWRGFFHALCTGELLWDAWYGPGSWHGVPLHSFPSKRPVFFKVFY